MVVARRARALRDEVGYHDLLADLRKPGCPACHGGHRAAWRYLDALLWEFVNDPEVRARLRASLGFCREHALMLLAVASNRSAGSGVGILYEDLLRHVREGLTSAFRSRTRSAGRRRRRSSERPVRGRCPACESANFVATNYARILATAPEDSPPIEGLRRPMRGICLPHLELGLRHARTEAQAARLVELYLRGEEELRADLTEFIRKQDYRFQSEGLTDAQATSWVRAVHRFVGEPLPRKPPER